MVGHRSPTTCNADPKRHPTRLLELPIWQCLPEYCAGNLNGKRKSLESHSQLIEGKTQTIDTLSKVEVFGKEEYRSNICFLNLHWVGTQPRTKATTYFQTHLEIVQSQLDCTCWIVGIIVLTQLFANSIVWDQSCFAKCNMPTT